MQLLLFTWLLFLPNNNADLLQTTHTVPYAIFEDDVLGVSEGPSLCLTLTTKYKEAIGERPEDSTCMYERDDKLQKNVYTVFLTQLSGDKETVQFIAKVSEEHIGPPKYIESGAKKIVALTSVNVRPYPQVVKNRMNKCVDTCISENTYVFQNDIMVGELSLAFDAESLRRKFNVSGQLEVTIKERFGPDTLIYPWQSRDVQDELKLFAGEECDGNLTKFFYIRSVAQIHIDVTDAAKFELFLSAIPELWQKQNLSTKIAHVKYTIQDRYLYVALYLEVNINNPGATYLLDIVLSQTWSWLFQNINEADHGVLFKWMKDLGVGPGLFSFCFNAAPRVSAPVASLVFYFIVRCLW